MYEDCVPQSMDACQGWQAKGGGGDGSDGGEMAVGVRQDEC